MAHVTHKNPWRSLSKAERILVALNTAVAVAGSIAILLVVGWHRGDWRGAILIVTMMLCMTAVVLVVPPWKRARDAARAAETPEVGRPTPRLPDPFRHGRDRRVG